MNVVDEEDHGQWINLYQNIADRLGGIGSVASETATGESGIRKDVFSFLERIRVCDRTRYDNLISFSRSYSTMDYPNKKQSLSGLAAQLH